MTFLRFLQVQMALYLFRWRWVLVGVVALIAAYLATDNMRVHVINHGDQPNLWDVLFKFWGNRHLHFLTSNILFVLLIGDITRESAWDNATLLRLKSRRAWWWGKIVLLAVCALAYLLVFVGATVATGWSAFPLTATWSDETTLWYGNWNINPGLFQYRPYTAFGLCLGLLFLGWFGLGLVTIITTMLTRNGVVGFGAGASVNFLGLLGSLDVLPPFLDGVSFHTHQLVNLHAFGDAASPYPTLAESFGYWGVVTGLLIGAGLVVVQHRDFIGDSA